MELSKKRTNSILVAQSISKLITKIKNDPQSSAIDIKYLKDKCITSDDAGIGLAASRGLIILVKCDVLQTTLTLSELVSSLALARCYAGITAAICDLLFLDLKRTIDGDEEKYVCAYNLRSPQHPLISLFIRSHDTYYDILSKIKLFYYMDDDGVTFYANELLFPFYMYILCNPTSDVPEQFHHELWNFIISIQESQSLNIIVYAIAWLQISTEKQVLRASKVLTAAINAHTGISDDNVIEVLVLCLTSVVCELIELELDPREVILNLYAVIEGLPDIKAIASCMLSMLVECVPFCPSNYLDDLLKLCVAIIRLGFSNKFVLHSLKSSILQWIAYGCLLSSNSLNIANQILLYIDDSDDSSNAHTYNLFSNKTFCHLKNTNRRIHAAVELNILSENLCSSKILEWLNRHDKVPVYILKNFFNYYISLFMNNNLDADIILKLIDILLKISNHFNETTTQLLTLFLYKLSNETDSRIHFALLKALPKMAVLKENLPLVLNTLESFHKGMFGLKSFVLTLFYDLWSTSEKCYMYLQNVLLASERGRDRLSDLYITKAYVIKQICLKRPEVHGRELVSHLSEILNKCRSETGGVATALAVDAIKGLCKSGIVDINSAWNELSPQFKSEKRVIVLLSFCGFMSETSYFESSECSELVMDDILKTLWIYATSSENSQVVSAAYNALACFTLEQVSLHFPDKYKIVSTHNTLGFNLIPGRYWINLLLNVQEFTLTSTGDLLIKLVSAEISEYRKGTYNVAEGQREPQNYNYLPESSIVRSLENYIRSQVTNWQKSPSKPVYLQCLRVLSREYSKPLPPVDWCFLQELVHVSESRLYCITIASHQVQLSGTARRLVENIITALCNVTQKVEDIETIYTNLKYLCNSIQPMTLRPFIEGSINFALEKAQNENDLQVFKSIVSHLCNVLSDENLHDVNRLMLSQVIVSTVYKLDINSILFDIISECIAVLPVRYIDELSSPRIWKEPTDKQIKMGIQIRCTLALKATVSPLTWLNDILDIENIQALHYKFFCKNLIQVMKSHRSSDYASSWIMELLGNIQSTIANKFMTPQHLKFLCDVFILSVIVLSGHDLYLTTDDELVEDADLRLRLLPQSVSVLIKLQHWKSCTSQIAEWLYHMVSSTLTPDDYKIAFFESLASLKHEDVFQKSSKWMTYVGINVPLNI